MDKEPTTVKIVVVGDGSVGKTCVLLSYTTDKFPHEYVPTVFDNYTAVVNVNGRDVNLSLWDTAGQETYDQLRTISYGSADVFLIVFSVVESSSFENALDKWYPELSKGNLSRVPKIFVGNKIDMRQDGNQKHIQKAAAEGLIKDKQSKYFECSALTQEGLKEIFDAGIKAGLVVIDQKNNTASSIPQNQQQEKKEGPCCQIF